MRRLFYALIGFFVASVIAAFSDRSMTAVSLGLSLAFGGIYLADRTWKTARSKKTAKSITIAVLTAGLVAFLFKASLSSGSNHHGFVPDAVTGFGALGPIFFVLAAKEILQTLVPWLASMKKPRRAKHAKKS